MTSVDLTSAELYSTKLPPLDRAKRLAATLLSEGSQASVALVARQLRDLLGVLDASDRRGFQRYLATEFQPDGAALRAAAQRYLADGTAEAAAALARAADPPRQELLRRINMAPGGTGSLVAMRSEIALDTHRPRRALSPWQRRATRVHQLARQYRAMRDPGILRDHGQLSL
jgi:malonyl-CoA decarboxylase